MTKLLLLLGTFTLQVLDNGQWNNISPDIRKWFKSVIAPNGVPCCDISDGYRVEWGASTEGGTFHYIVKIDGIWMGVPDKAVIRNIHNPVGEAIVWYIKSVDEYRIRCFVPSNEI